MNKPFQLWQGDCLRLMSRIPNQSVDLVLCDLPYGTTACKWDVIIPFEPLWAHYKRIIKTKGAIVLTASQPFTSMLVMSNLKWFKYCWVWCKQKPTDFLNAKNKPLKAHEDVCVFSYSTTANCSKNKMVYIPQMGFGESYKRQFKTDPRRGVVDVGNRKKWIGITKNYNERYPTSILRIDRSNKDRIHPTQKPVALMEYLIKTYTNPGDLVLDNCMGSGTTGIACARTNRRFIGIEKDPEYFKLAEHRIRIAEKTGMVVGKPEKLKFGFFQ